MEKNMQIPKEKFEFVNTGDRISDVKFEDKPIGYFRDAWNRFCKNKASVVAAIIIICVVLFAFAVPLFSNMSPTFMDTYYSKKAPRMTVLRSIGLMDGGMKRDLTERGMIKEAAIGMAAEDHGGTGKVTLEEGMDSYYQPVMKIGKETVTLDAAKKEKKLFSGSKVDVYLDVGFIYRSLKASEYEDILAWQEETGLQVFYPLIEDNEYNPDSSDANNWYKATSKGDPVRVLSNGQAKKIAYEEGMTLEDNYKRDENGNPVYYQHTGGGGFDNAQYRVRVLYYNYYRYQNGFEPNYLLGTDSQGYDMAQRLAGGIKLSLLVAVCVSVINFIIGALYGAVEGYYGGVLDIVLERISDILNGVPFIVVATLFQIHLSAKVGAVPCLLFAFVLTGWLGKAYRVRTQFYRFKNQEYVMAARTLGAKDSRIIWKHIFPNTLGTIITSCALVIPSVVFSESMLSYLGIVKLGSADTTSLGTLLSDAAAIWTNYPHLMIVPAVVISLLMISFNLFGNGLRDAFNPSLRGVEE